MGQATMEERPSNPKRPPQVKLEQPGPRKKHRHRRDVDGDSKGTHAHAHAPVSRSLLAQYYSSVLTLREYALSRLPSASRIRRKKISRVGKGARPLPEIEAQLSHLLDTTLVGAWKYSPGKSEGRWQELVTASQQSNEESDVTLSDRLGSGTFSQSDIVDFTIWLHFSRSGRGASRPKHLLCDGFSKAAGLNVQRQQSSSGEKHCIPGLLSRFPNHHVDVLKRPPWPQLLMLLGKSGERIMIDLLLDCGIYLAVDAGAGNLWQLSGQPLFDLEPLDDIKPPAMTSFSGPAMPVREPGKPPADITFVRSRILYARAAVTTKGNIENGLRHIHILNRAPHKPLASHTVGTSAGSGSDNPVNDENTLRVMAYMFPRQFGLHNVFTSTVDRTRTTQKFQDYTLREDEISAKFRVADGEESAIRICLPKRLRGEVKSLVQRLQVLHARCSYVCLFEHHCPNPIESGRKQEASQQGDQETSLPLVPPTQQVGGPNKRAKRKNTKGKKTKPSNLALDLQGKSITDLATSVSQVSAFCQAVLSKIIPNEFWGTGPSQKHNKDIVLRYVDHFVRLRRFENMSLHDVFQGIKISDIGWLAPPTLKGSKMSQTDKEKRTEIFYEFLYYVFDSLLIPLIRCNFYVTESSKHKYRLFYFRHDVWKCISEPALSTLKSTLLEETKPQDALSILDSRKLGTSHLRLVPKGSVLRPIMNLRRRALLRGSRQVLGSSINSILGPVQRMLSLEKESNPSRLGSSMFSVGELYGRLKNFRSNMRQATGKRLFFAKVDVQLAFDTMPQDAVIELMQEIPTEVRYLIQKYVEVKPGDSLGGRLGRHKAVVKPSTRWKSVASKLRDRTTFRQCLEKRLAPSKRNTVFVDNSARMSYETKHLLTLIKSHVGENLVRFGKKYYRQKHGVPQGSILSALFCSYLYGDLERKHLPFLAEEEKEGGSETLLLRLIDDFLLITTDRAKAVRFLRVMHAGLPDYGVTINPAKSLVNFDVEIDSGPLPRIPASSPGFPYCGTLIDERTLEVSKNRTNPSAPATATATATATLFDSLTVEASRRPGANFERKVLNAFRLQSHMMYFDTSHNSRTLALANLRAALTETVRKACAYVRCLAPDKRPREEVFIRVVEKLVGVAHGLLTSRARRTRFPGYECGISRPQVMVLTLEAFREVLMAKQTGYRGVIRWIEEELKGLEEGGKLKRRIRGRGVEIE